jgi:hypothetical protein
MSSMQPTPKKVGQSKQTELTSAQREFLLAAFTKLAADHELLQAKYEQLLKFATSVAQSEQDLEFVNFLQSINLENEL